MKQDLESNQSFCKFQSSKRIDILKTLLLNWNFLNSKKLRSLRNNLYTHTLSIVVFVKTARLWESPANYLRKHLGLTNYWTLSNGTIVRLSRIHQK